MPKFLSHLVPIVVTQYREDMSVQSRENAPQSLRRPKGPVPQAKNDIKLMHNLVPLCDKFCLHLEDVCERSLAVLDDVLVAEVEIRSEEYLRGVGGAAVFIVLDYRFD
jgi:hypothetical protein